mgnify:CR=1 FL=1
MKRRSPGSDWCLDIKLQQGSVKERVAETLRQGIVETWETTARRDQDPKENDT